MTTVIIHITILHSTQISECIWKIVRKRGASIIIQTSGRTKVLQRMKMAITHFLTSTNSSFTSSRIPGK